MLNLMFNDGVARKVDGQSVPIAKVNNGQKRHMNSTHASSSRQHMLNSGWVGQDQCKCQGFHYMYSQSSQSPCLCMTGSHHSNSHSSIPC